MAANVKAWGPHHHHHHHHDHKLKSGGWGVDPVAGLARPEQWRPAAPQVGARARHEAKSTLDTDAVRGAGGGGLAVVETAPARQAPATRGAAEHAEAP